jgi:hypothetical protein
MRGILLCGHLGYNVVIKSLFIVIIKAIALAKLWMFLLFIYFRAEFMTHNIKKIMIHKVED